MEGGEDDESPPRERPARVELIEGPVAEVAKYLDMSGSHRFEWNENANRFQSKGVPEEWQPWGSVPPNSEGWLQLRGQCLSWMACTSKVLQTVDNKHLNRHTDYLYGGPTVNFVDLQLTPHVGRRMQALAHLTECMNNYGEFPMDCVVPTPHTEILFGQGKSNRLVRGMRMKNSTQRVSKSIDFASDCPSGEKWLKSFRRSVTDDQNAGVQDPDEEVDKNDSGMVETQMVRMVVRIFPVAHAGFKGIGRVISLVGLPGVNIAKCLQRVCDPRYYPQTLKRSR